MTTTTRVTKRQAEQTLAVIKKQFATFISAGYDEPTLVMDWEQQYGGICPAILWEDGPFEWAYLAGHGGRDTEFGMTVPPAALPNGVWVEPYYSFVLCIYRDGKDMA